MTRWQLPVSSPIAASGIGAAARAAVGTGPSSAEMASRVAARFGARAAVLTNSGTSALVLALRELLPPGGTVALPAYACIDLTAAAVFVGLRVRLYDIDPRTLSADLASVEATMRLGVDAIVVAHLYGFPSDVPGVSALARAHGVRLVEDAAQGAGGTLGGVRLGGFGELSVLSFGRGKGTCAGRGGALLAFDPALAARLEEIAIRLGEPARGAGVIPGTAAQWLLGRPSLYGIPSRIPALHLGEMRYHPAREPRSMERAALAMLRAAMELDSVEQPRRRENARLLASLIRGSDARAARPIPGGDPGYLRLPMLDSSGTRRPAPRLGVLRGYPQILSEHEPIRPWLLPAGTDLTGALELRRTLFTLPTHSMVSATDVARIGRWLARESARGGVVMTADGVAP